MAYCQRPSPEPLGPPAFLNLTPPSPLVHHEFFFRQIKYFGKLLLGVALLVASWWSVTVLLIVTSLGPSSYDVTRPLAWRHFFFYSPDVVWLTVKLCLTDVTSYVIKYISAWSHHVLSWHRVYADIIQAPWRCHLGWLVWRYSGSVVDSRVLLCDVN